MAEPQEQQEQQDQPPDKSPSQQQQHLEQLEQIRAELAKIAALKAEVAELQDVEHQIALEKAEIEMLERGWAERKALMQAEMARLLMIKDAFEGRLGAASHPGD